VVRPGEGGAGVRTVCRPLPGRRIGGACALDAAAFSTTTIETLTHFAIGPSAAEGSLPVRS